MSKKVVLFSTYFLEDQNDYLFGKRNRFDVELFKSPAMLDYLLDDSQTLESCSDYFAMMDWKDELIRQGLWREDFELPYWGDVLDTIDAFYKNDVSVYNEIVQYVNNILVPELDLSSGQIEKEKIKKRISEIPDNMECQGFADGVLNIYWGGGDAPELPLLNRRFSLYLLKNEKCPDYATYAVWSLRFYENNDVNKWRDALIDEILKRNSDCEEIILALHEKDAGRTGIPFVIYEPKKKWKATDIFYSVVLYEHVSSRIHPLLRDHLSSKEVYNRISEMIKAY